MKQVVAGTDPALEGDHKYRIVITFTGASRMKTTGMYRSITSMMVICLLLSSIVLAVGAASSDSVTISGYILPHQAPHADFTASPRSGSTPLTVQFTDTSSESPSVWSWDFQNDGTVDSHAKNPSYTYSYPGTYSVKLAGN